MGSMGVLPRWGVLLFSFIFLFIYSQNASAGCWQQWWYDNSTGNCVQVKNTSAGSVEWAFHAESECACYEEIKTIVCEDSPKPESC
jgi:hypothetical protein